MRNTPGERSFKCCYPLFASMAYAAMLPACTDSSAIDADLGSASPDAGVSEDLSGPSADLGETFVTPIDDKNDTVVPADYWPWGADRGVASPTDRFRSLIVFPVRDLQPLTNTVNSLYNPASPRFRGYLSFEDWLVLHAPPQADVDAVVSWLKMQGMTVDRVARNRLMLQYSGTVAQWNTAFGATLHVVDRSETSTRDSAYAPLTEVTVPAALAGKIKLLLMPDQAIPAGLLAKDVGPINTTMPPYDDFYSPSEIAGAYGLNELYAQGFRGAGMTIGVVGGSSIKISDAQSMWQSFGINRSSPVLQNTMEPPTKRDSEPTLDIELAGALAPDANLIYYQGPDSTDTSLVYSLNEAIGLAQAQVLSFSFSHAEVNTPYAVSRAYNQSALVAAALGITVVAAAGDSKQVDTPSNSPYVTAVGGTNVSIDGNGEWASEDAWIVGGCGKSRIFPRPPFQNGIVSGTARSVADVAANTGIYWIKYLGNWVQGDGTSSATPVVAAILTVANQYRRVHGKPVIGYLNPLLYQDAATRSAFRDITTMQSGSCAAGPGYDPATGFGSPKAPEVAAMIP